MIDFAVKRLMELGAVTGYGEKSAERIAQRNGYCHYDSNGVDSGMACTVNRS